MVEQYRRGASWLPILACARPLESHALHASVAPFQIPRREVLVRVRPGANCRASRSSDGVKLSGVACRSARSLSEAASKDNRDRRLYRQLGLGNTAETLTSRALGRINRKDTTRCWMKLRRQVRGMRHGPGSTGERHNDKGGPSSDAARSREPESLREAIGRQSENLRQMETAAIGRRLANGAERTEVDGAVGQGRGDRCRLSNIGLCYSLFSLLLFYVQSNFSVSLPVCSKNSSSENATSGRGGAANCCCKRPNASNISTRTME